MGKVIWSPAALDDVDGIAEFIARDSPARAALFAERLIESTDRLNQFPELGRSIPEMSDSLCREVSVGSYRVMYRIDEGAVWITAVVHGARDWPGE